MISESHSVPKQCSITRLCRLPISVFTYNILDCVKFTSTVIGINNDLCPSQLSLFIPVHNMILVNIWFLLVSLNLLSLSNHNTILTFQIWIHLIRGLSLFKFDILLLNRTGDLIIGLRELLISTRLWAYLSTTLIFLGDLLRILICIITQIWIRIVHHFKILLLEGSAVVVEDHHFCRIRWRIGRISILLIHTRCAMLTIPFDTISSLVLKLLFISKSFGRTRTTRNTLLPSVLH